MHSPVDQSWEQVCVEPSCIHGRCKVGTQHIIRSSGDHIELSSSGMSEWIQYGLKRSAALISRELFKLPVGKATLDRRERYLSN